MTKVQLKNQETEKPRRRQKYCRECRDRAEQSETAAAADQKLHQDNTKKLEQIASQKQAAELKKTSSVSV